MEIKKEKPVVLEPNSDWMELQMEEISSSIAVPEHYKSKSKKTIAYKILSIGSGYYDNGVFIKSTAKVGDLVLLDAPMVAEFEYRGIVHRAAMARNIAFKIIEKG